MDSNATDTFKAQMGSKDMLNRNFMKLRVYFVCKENKAIIFVFFAHKKYYFNKIMVKPLMSLGLFYRCPCYVSGPWTW